MSVLTEIQNELKAPKNRFNKFGNYHYRSCEDILEGIKPLLAKHNATVTIRDDVVEVGNRVYVKAIVLFHAFNEDGTLLESAEVTAFAREAESKKGMDDSQITGTASSYARKYALNGLFLIDDTKDADTDEYAQQMEAVAAKKIGSVKGKALEKLLTDAGQNVEAFVKFYRVEKLDDLTEEQHYKIVNELQKRQKNGSNGKA